LLASLVSRFQGFPDAQSVAQAYLQLCSTANKKPTPTNLLRHIGDAYHHFLLSQPKTHSPTDTQ
jgi:hypothetical protein